MSEQRPSYRSWGNCDLCGFQGTFVYRIRPDENYEDAEALGVMLDCTCPACGTDECVLVAMEHFEEMVRFSGPPGR